MLSVKPLPKDKIMDLSKLKALAENKINVTQKLKFVWDRVKWVPAFSPFTTMFSKGFLYRAVKRLDYVVNS